MKKLLKYLLFSLMLVAVVGGGAFWVWAESRAAHPAEAALGAMQSDDLVVVEEGQYVRFRPAGGEPVAGLIVYPGASCDVRGYAPLMREIAAAGYLVIGVPMPLNMAIFSPNRASAVRAAHPEISQWVIAGHSMGGAMAGYHAYHHTDELAGLVLWDSFPPETSDFSSSELPIWTIFRATLEGEPPEHFAAADRLLPPAARRVPVPGGIHMHFGSFDGGGYVEEWEPQISAEESQAIIIDATLDAMREMTGG